MANGYSRSPKLLKGALVQFSAPMLVPIPNVIVFQYNPEQLMNVVLAPIVSEKSTMVADKNEQVVFRVADAATKPEIKAAVELLFKVKVESVQVLSVKGKEKRFGRMQGRRRSWKKAYVCLAPGQEINFGALE